MKRRIVATKTKKILARMGTRTMKKILTRMRMKTRTMKKPLKKTLKKTLKTLQNRCPMTKTWNLGIEMIQIKNRSRVLIEPGRLYSCYVVVSWFWLSLV